jgi:RHS repeat-associated protein
MPFGEEWPAPSSAERRLYGAKEREPETGFDYSGARYYAPSSGRFTSPDPLTADPLRIVNPQRWNRYAYAANNPLAYGDPDGLDVIVFNFVNGAGGNGHIGIMAVDPNTGAGLYGGFNPAHDGLWSSIHDREGNVVFRDFPAGYMRFSDGRITEDSLRQVKGDLRELENQSGQVRSLYFRTSKTQTATLREFILRTQKHPPAYTVTSYNCQQFCIRGLWAAGIDAPVPKQLFEATPNVYFALTLSELAWRLSVTPVPNVSTSYCFQGEKGCGP